jgi:hypothetical protein
MTEEYIHHPIIDTLPDHTDQLNKITKVGKNVMKKFDLDKRSYPPLTEKSVETMDYILHKCLRKTADLSMSINEIETKLKDHYTCTYTKSPELGKKLFLDHYFSLHKPYDKVKNMLWKAIFTITEYKKNKF